MRSPPNRLRSLPGLDAGERRRGRVVPRLARPTPGDLGARRIGDLYPDRLGTRRHQDQPIQSVRTLLGVAVDDVRAGRVTEQRKPFQTKVDSECLDVVGDAIAAVRRRVVRCAGRPAPAMVEEDELGVLCQATEVPEVVGRQQRATRDTDEGGSGSDSAVSETGAVRSEEVHDETPFRTRGRCQEGVELRLNDAPPWTGAPSQLS